MTPDFDAAFDGLFGLAFPSISSPGFEPPLFTLAKQGLLNANQFSFTLGEDGGRLDLGRAPGQHLNTPTWIKVVRPQFWAISVDWVAVDTRSVDPSKLTRVLNASPQLRRYPLARTASSRMLELTANGIGLLDSGTTTVLCPTAMAAQINRLIGASDNGLHVDCSASTTGPTLYFSVSDGRGSPGYVVAIAPHQYILGDGDSAHGCMSAFQPGSPNNKWILGLPFFANHTITFDIDSGRIGFSQARSDPAGYEASLSSTADPELDTAQSPPAKPSVRNIFDT
ncbi:hypothetical protein GGF46_005360, partial [Coemansia sp. RSA 552]